MSNPELTHTERAYRRGCLQAVQYVIEDLVGLTSPTPAELLALWQQALISARDSEDVSLLGTYLDTVRKRIGDADTKQNAAR